MPLRLKGADDVLFIEDSPGDVLLTNQLLADYPVPVKLKIARDGEQALMMLADPTFNPVMIILDLNIPKVSGFEVLERNPRKDIPVVIFSASINRSDIDRALVRGARDYIQKPIEIDAYRGAVVGMIKRWVLPKWEASGADT
jgi:CheY-like chemotaxis protein